MLVTALMTEVDRCLFSEIAWFDGQEGCQEVMKSKARLRNSTSPVEKATGRQTGMVPRGERKRAERLVPNPAHGEKSDFVKVTVTLPPAVYELIVLEATRRKMSKERNPVISAIIREAAVAYLEGR